MYLVILNYYLFNDKYASCCNERLFLVTEYL